MRKRRTALSRLYLIAVKLAALARTRAVQKEHQLGTTHRLGANGGPLMTRKYFDFGDRDRPKQLNSYMPANSIIGSQRIPIAQNQHACHSHLPLQRGRKTSSLRLPFPSTSWMQSGISPN